MHDSFCGWYFKCQSAEQTLAMIPAVHISGGEQTCSIQIIGDQGSWNVPLSRVQPRIQKNKPYAALGENFFCPDGVRLDLHARGVSATGQLRFGPPAPIRYDIMGPFRHVPFMECRHSVFSMRHRVDGKLRINGAEYCFANGTGYLEGDRGRSFPKHYVWTQCCFSGGSLMLSVAEIPLGPVRFTGVIAVVFLDGKEYRLASYLGAKVAYLHSGEVVVRQGNLQLTATLLEKKAYSLHAPFSGQMTRLIRENVACHAHYQLRTNNRTILDLETQKASFEYEYP